MYHTCPLVQAKMRNSFCFWEEASGRLIWKGKILRAFVFCVVLLVMAQPAWAWWDSGHILVADIAWEAMRADTKAEVEELLAYHPDPLVRTLAESSHWPDQVRLKEHPLHKHHRETWHYQNLPIQKFADGVEREVVYGGDLNEQLVKQVQMMADKSLPKAERAVALSWVVHLIGDIHQPLHNASLFNEQFPQGDRGGNSFEVILNGKPLPLHYLWDSGGGRFIDPVSPEKLTWYRDSFMKRHPKSRFEGELRVDTVGEWAQEGLQIAREAVYRDDVLQGQALPQQALEHAQDLSERQMALAGYRLAQVLDRNLGNHQAWFFR